MSESSQPPHLHFLLSNERSGRSPLWLVPKRKRIVHPVNIADKDAFQNSNSIGLDYFFTRIEEALELANHVLYAAEHSGAAPVIFVVM